MPDDELLALVDQRLHDWDRRIRQWYRVYYIVGGSAVFFTVSLGVASGHNFFQKYVILLSILAWLAAVFQGISTFLVAFSKATAYRAAWRVLWLARFDYVGTGYSEDSRKLLEQAIEKGWAMIDGGYSEAFQAFRTLRSGPRPEEPVSN